MDNEQLLRSLRSAFPSHDTTGFEAFDFIHAFGSGREALLYARLFWPEFIEFRGMVLLKATIETDDDRRRAEGAFEKYNSDVVETEQSLNLVEIPHLFGRRIGEADDEEDRLLAEIVAEVWRCRLKTLFPDRHFVVGILEAEDTGGEIAVMFSQERGVQKP